MLLCDYLRTDMGFPKDFQNTGAYRFFRETGDLVGNADRYVFDTSATEAAVSAMVSKPSSMLSALPLVRAPSPLTWIEFVDADRARALEAHGRIIHDTQGAHPIRIGFLIFADEEGRPELASPVWAHSFDQEPPSVCFWSLSFEMETSLIDWIEARATADAIEEKLATSSPDEIALNEAGFLKGNRSELEAYAALTSLVRIAPTPAADVVINAMKASGGMDGQLAAIIRSHEADASNEWRMVVASLLLLNTDALDHETVDRERLNRKRDRARKPRLLGHQVVRLRREFRPSESGTGTGSPKRAHLCRGHFRRLKNPDRIIWVRAHLRGSGRVPGTGRTRTLRV